MATNGKEATSIPPPATKVGKKKKAKQEPFEDIADDNKESENEYINIIKKKVRAQRKKLDEIEGLEKLESSGKELKPEQKGKVADKQRVLKGINELEKFIEQFSVIHKQQRINRTGQEAVNSLVTLIHSVHAVEATVEARQAVLAYSRSLGKLASIREEADIGRISSLAHEITSGSEGSLQAKLGNSLNVALNLVTEQQTEYKTGVTYRRLAIQSRELAVALANFQSSTQAKTTQPTQEVSAPVVVEQQPVARPEQAIQPAAEPTAEVSPTQSVVTEPAVAAAQTPLKRPKKMGTKKEQPAPVASSPAEQPPHPASQQQQQQQQPPAPPQQQPVAAQEDEIQPAEGHPQRRGGYRGRGGRRGGRGGNRGGYQNYEAGAQQADSDHQDQSQSQQGGRGGFHSPRGRGGYRPYRGGDGSYRGGDGSYRGGESTNRGGDRPNRGGNKPYRGSDNSGYRGGSGYSPQQPRTNA